MSRQWLHRTSCAAAGRAQSRGSGTMSRSPAASLCHGGGVPHRTDAAVTAPRATGAVHTSLCDPTPLSGPPPLPREPLSPLSHPPQDGCTGQRYKPPRDGDTSIPGPPMFLFHPPARTPRQANPQRCPQPRMELLRAISCLRAQPCPKRRRGKARGSRQRLSLAPSPHRGGPRADGQP